MVKGTTTRALLVACLCVYLAEAQGPVPQRLQIPGALPVPVRGPVPHRLQIPGALPVPVRGRNAVPAQPSPVRPLPPRPVEEEVEEYDDADEEVTTALPTLPPPVFRSPPRPQPIRSEGGPPFRPERPVQQFARPQINARPAPQQIVRQPAPQQHVVRQQQQPARQFVSDEARQQFRQPARPVVHAELQEAPRQQFRQPARAVVPAELQEAPRQQFRQPARPVVRTEEAQEAPRRQQQQPTRQFVGDELQEIPRQQQQAARPFVSQQPRQQGRERKPVAQVLRKYRDDNPDGSITWGYENDDGSYKEETIGIDCVVSGKYGYVDPEGMRREYTYSSGISCDKTEPQSQYIVPDLVNRHKSRRPTN